MIAAEFFVYDVITEEVRWLAQRIPTGWRTVGLGCSGGRWGGALPHHRRSPLGGRGQKRTPEIEASLRPRPRG